MIRDRRKENMLLKIVRVKGKYVSTEGYRHARRAHNDRSAPGLKLFKY